VRAEEAEEPLPPITVDEYNALVSLLNLILIWLLAEDEPLVTNIKSV
jgi:hypothetical protein